MHRIAKTALAVAYLLISLACSSTRTQDMEVTPWFTVRQQFPKKTMGAALGGPQVQAYYAAVAGQWVMVGQGDRGRVLSLDGGKAVLFTADVAGELQLIYEGEGAPKPLSQIALPGEQVTVSPEGRFLDFLRCETRGFSGCISLELTRYIVRTKRSEKRTVGLPVSETGCDYPVLAVVGYDGGGNPYFAGKCEGMNPRCILVAPRAEGLLIRTRAKSPDSFLCGRPEYWTPDLAAPLMEPARFTQLPVAPAE